jgi:hypothetical protein
MAMYDDLAIKTKNDADRIALEDSVIGKSIHEVMNALHAIDTVEADSEARAHEGVDVYYLLAPLLGTSASSRRIDKILAEYDTTDYASSRHLPAHGFLVFYHDIDNLHKRRISFSVGDFQGAIRTIEELLRVPKEVPSLFGLEDVMLKSDGTSWEVVGGKQIDGSSLSVIRADIDRARIARVMRWHVSMNYLKEFLLCMSTNDRKPYNLLTHNCQHQSHEIMNFFERKYKPHWWSDECSARMLKSFLNDQHHHDATVNGIAVTQYHPLGKASAGNAINSTAANLVNTRHSAVPGITTNNVHVNAEAVLANSKATVNNFLSGLIT